MKRQRMDVSCVLIKTEIPGVWASWCPELDLMSQGDNPENAIGMLMDAIHLMVVDSISFFRWEGDAEVKKRVVHPSRLGDHASEDEHWEAFSQWKSHTGKWRHQADISPRQLEDGLDPIACIHGSLEWQVRGGIASASVDFYDYAYVPAQYYRVTVSSPKIKQRYMVIRASKPQAADRVLKDYEETLLSEHEKILKVEEVSE